MFAGLPVNRPQRLSSSLHHCLALSVSPAARSVASADAEIDRQSSAGALNRNPESSSIAAIGVTFAAHCGSISAPPSCDCRQLSANSHSSLVMSCFSDRQIERACEVNSSWLRAPVVRSARRASASCTKAASVMTAARSRAAASSHQHSRSRRCHVINSASLGTILVSSRQQQQQATAAAEAAARAVESSDAAAAAISDSHQNGSNVSSRPSSARIAASSPSAQIGSPTLIIKLHGARHAIAR